MVRQCCRDVDCETSSIPAVCPPGRPPGHTHGPGAIEARVDQEALPDTRLDMIVLALVHV